MLCGMLSFLSHLVCTVLLLSFFSHTLYSSVLSGSSEATVWVTSQLLIHCGVLSVTPCIVVFFRGHFSVTPFIFVLSWSKLVDHVKKCYSVDDLSC